MNNLIKTIFLSVVIIFISIDSYSSSNESIKNLILLDVSDKTETAPIYIKSKLTNLINNSIESLKRFNISQIQHSSIGSINELEGLLKYIKSKKENKTDNAVMFSSNVSSKLLNILINSYFIVIPELIYYETYNYDIEADKIDNNIRHTINITIDLVIKTIPIDSEGNCSTISISSTKNSSLYSTNLKISDKEKDSLRKAIFRKMEFDIISQLDDNLKNNECFSFKSVVLEVLKNDKVVIGIGSDMGVENGDEYILKDNVNNEDISTYIRIDDANKRKSTATILWGNAIKDDEAIKNDISGIGIEIKAAFLYWKRNKDFIKWIDYKKTKSEDNFAELTTISLFKEISYSFKFSLDFSMMVPSYEIEKTYYPGFFEFSLAYSFFLGDRLSIELLLSAGACFFFGHREYYPDKNALENSERHEVTGNSYGIQTATNIYYFLSPNVRLLAGLSFRHYKSIFIKDDDLTDIDNEKKIEIDMGPMFGINLGINFRF